MANKIKTFLNDEMNEFVLRKRPILGICNGFQMLTKLEFFNFKSIRLAHNESGKFIDTWSDLKINSKNTSPWLTLWQNKKEIKLPIRHGEGRLVVGSEVSASDLETQIALTYSQNPNGAFASIAGITDKTGLILGMMPHPEAASFCATDLKKMNQGAAPSIGLDLFHSINHFLKNS
jgi:phosphoribosylformylglycinamidine synthase